MKENLISDSNRNKNTEYSDEDIVKISDQIKQEPNNTYNQNKCYKFIMLLVPFINLLGIQKSIDIALNRKNCNSSILWDPLVCITPYFPIAGLFLNSTQLYFIMKNLLFPDWLQNWGKYHGYLFVLFSSTMAGVSLMYQNQCYQMDKFMSSEQIVFPSILALILFGVLIQFIMKIRKQFSHNVYVSPIDDDDIK